VKIKKRRKKDFGVYFDRINSNMKKRQPTQPRSAGSAACSNCLGSQGGCSFFVLGKVDDLSRYRTVEWLLMEDFAEMEV
jgi:hypothetical protein